MKIIAGIIAIFVAITMIGGVLVPVVADGLTVVGDPVTYENAIDVNAPQHYGKLDDFTVTVESTDDSYTVVANGVSMTKTAAGQPVIFSDVLTISLSNLNSSTVATLNIFEDALITETVVVGVTKKMIIAFNNGEWSVSIDGTETYSGSFVWAFTVDPNGGYVTNSGSRNVYVNNVFSDIVYSGNYETGELDTGYFSYYDGRMNLSNPNYTGELNYTSNLVNGTTDINYITGRGITITDGTTTESFSAYRCLVKETINGHEAGGSAYAVLSAVVPLLIVALIVGAVAITMRRD